MDKINPSLEVKSIYKNNKTKVRILCHRCNTEFDARPSTLCRGVGCPYCAGNKLKSTQTFIDELSLVNKDVMVLGTYTGNKEKIRVKCNICGNVWEAIPNALLCGRRCPECFGNKRKTQEKFIAEMGEKHPDIIVIGQYINSRTKIECHCNKCNQNFLSTPKSMLRLWTGCPRCNDSTGEERIRSWLINNNFDYIQEYKFNDCKDKRALPFDFFIPSKCVTIEFDGKQHFAEYDRFGGAAALEINQRHDKIKTDYCNTHNIKLIRIPYWEFKNIPNILSKELAN